MKFGRIALYCICRIFSFVCCRDVLGQWYMCSDVLCFCSQIEKLFSSSSCLNASFLAQWVNLTQYFVFYHILSFCLTGSFAGITSRQASSWQKLLGNSCTGQVPLLSPNQQCQSIEWWNIVYFHLWLWWSFLKVLICWREDQKKMRVISGISIEWGPEEDFWKIIKWY